MRKGIICIALSAMLFAVSAPAEAQQTKMYRIGFLRGAPPLEAHFELFRQTLKELGYIEGKNITLEYRWAEGKADQLPTLAAELAGKQLELLKEIMPRLLRLAVLRDLTEPGNPRAVKETEHAAQGLGVQLYYMEVQGADKIESAFHIAGSKRPDALLVLSSAIFNSNRQRIVNLATKNRFPAMYPRAEFVEEGGFMTYGVNTPDLYRRAATFVDKILKGAKPGDLPVEQPTKFDFIVNLKTAKQLGLTLPPNVLVRADRVIK